MMNKSFEKKLLLYFGKSNFYFTLFYYYYLFIFNFFYKISPLKKTLGVTGVNFTLIHHINNLTKFLRVHTSHRTTH